MDIVSNKKISTSSVAHALNYPIYKSIFYQCFLKLVNLLFCSISFLPLLVLIPVISIINKLTDPGPLFYWQDRIGLNGKVFRILKFRTMKVDAEVNGPQWTKLSDNRITWFGRILRESHLDELPQCYNILMGQMNLIGPRPERPVFAKRLTKKIPNYNQRHLIKPGLTGWAQIHQMYSASVDETSTKLDYDLYYLIHRNWILDLYIMARTMGLVVNFRGR